MSELITIWDTTHNDAVITRLYLVVMKMSPKCTQLSPTQAFSGEYRFTFCSLKTQAEMKKLNQNACLLQIEKETENEITKCVNGDDLENRISERCVRYGHWSAIMAPNA